MGLQLKGGQTPGRNEPCPCDSGLKYKHCHGDVLKVAVCNRVANETMVRLIAQTKFKKGMVCEHGVATGEHCPDCKIGDNKILRG